ncbi:MAG: MBL fold metallo-hydrolase [Methanobacteriaceae archaeon]|nr:MBL fold metallo-hydrolase [Methanobacteriaceae archaeon]
MFVDKMSQEIKTIKLEIFSGLASVNCYLIKNDQGFILIDTGISKSRDKLEKELKSAGVNPKNLNLIIITHGDTDHTGNCSYLREKYQAKIAMHHDDKGMVEKGDMLWNRKGSILLKIINPFMGLGKSDRFKPDFYIDDNFELSDYGLDAKVIHIPGHSLGSIGILTKEGDLFCGDLMSNNKKPARNSIMDDKITAKKSIEKLRKFNINHVFPGHGESFSWLKFI